MDGTEAAVWFLGDLKDPWVRTILESIRSVAPTRAIRCEDVVPERPFDPASPPHVIVLHRQRLGPADAAQIDHWKPVELPGATESVGPPGPRIILCHGPYVRYAELERCDRSIDLLVPEATASETLPRQLLHMLGTTGAERPTTEDCSPHVEVASSDYALRAVLCDACTAAGYRATDCHGPRREGREPNGPSVLTIWDVPVLEPDWPERLREMRHRGPVIALLGFPDRSTVKLARDHGAEACLEVPFHLDDLVYALDRLTQSLRPVDGLRREEAHAVPPAPTGRVNRGRESIRHRPSRAGGWADREEPHKMI